MEKISLHKKDMFKRPKPENVTLRKEDITWLERLDFPLRPKDKQKLFRLRNKLKMTLEHLIWMTLLLPGKQQERVFTVENLKGFIEALLTNFAEKKGASIVKNERVFHVAFMLAQKGIRHGTDLIKSPSRLFLTTPQYISPDNTQVLNFIYELLKH